MSIADLKSVKADIEDILQKHFESNGNTEPDTNAHIYNESAMTSYAEGLESALDIVVSHIQTNKQERVRVENIVTYRWYWLSSKTPGAEKEWSPTCWHSKHKDCSDWNERQKEMYRADVGNKDAKLVRETTSFSDTYK